MNFLILKLYMCSDKFVGKSNLVSSRVEFIYSHQVLIFCSFFAFSRLQLHVPSTSYTVSVYALLVAMDREIERLQRSLVITEDEAVMIPEGLCSGLEERPWNFDKNLIVLAIVRDSDKRSSTMPWILVHPSAHSRSPFKNDDSGSAIFVGNRLGRFKDVHLDNSGVSWDSTLKLTVEIDVTKPLKRVLQLNSPLGESYIVTFQYERLPNFCYLCGKICHLATYCLLRYSKDFKDLGAHTPFGPWLRAPLSNSRVRPASHLDGDLDMDVQQPVSRKNITSLSRSPYPFTNSHALILSASLSPIGDKADAIPSHQNDL
ncbi:hypothetical protein BUALT_Bualt07G0036500 [Buddleja alternifolia]|uniref:Zinc knuckle CX2CX4HX4C domain-containing protein n=1 Tax=Buddleja alternifolia TaxID=168488 RepID=A0AAV6XEM5_9LAMI|nr:hypothetical protein BUALT_Bualt07G0036500 [Buddleja alternifolia]